MEKVEDFSLHWESGVVVRDQDFLVWLESHAASELGSRIVAYSWNVNGRHVLMPADAGRATWSELPDSSGFLLIERQWMPNNCLLMDAFGNERMRLTVPWQLTRQRNPESAQPPTSFASRSSPYINPVDGKEGKFGVTAWVEHAGRYYFELDYYRGEFLWGREIRD